MISIVLPVFNELELVPELHRRLSVAADRLGEPVEILFVDDGSSDGTGEALDRIAAADPRVGVLHFSRNFGHQPACTAGLEAARGDAVVLMDGDLQDPPEVIPALVRAWKEGAEVVFARRRSRDERFLRGTGVRLFYAVMGRLMEFPIPLDAGVFGLMDRRALDTLLSLPERSRFLPGMRAWVGYRQVAVEYDRERRAGGEPKLSFPTLFRYAIDGITSFSYRPLRAATLLGFAVSGFSLLHLARVVMLRLTDGDRAALGHDTLVGAVLLLGGIQLLTIGVLGEYVGRIFEEVRRRPLYVLRSRTGAGGPPAGGSN